MKKRKDKIYLEDKKISTYVIFYFIASSCNMAIKNILPIPENLWGLLSALWGASILFFMLRAIRIVWKRNSTLFYSSYLIFGTLFLISILLSVIRGEPINLILRDSLFVNFAWWIPVGVYACSVYDKNVLFDIMFKGSFVISIVLLTYFHLGRVAMTLGEANMYSMTFGFAFILPIILHVSKLFSKFNLWLLSFVLLEVFTLFVFANRGVILSLLFYLGYKTLQVGGKNAKSFFILAIMACVTVVILLTSNNLLGSVNDFLDRNNMQSRTLIMLSNNTIGDDSGRYGVWNICFDMILDSPIWGWGLGGEYYHIAECAGVPMNDVSASAFTPHNSIIQALINFGIIGGIFVFVLFIRPLLRLKRIKDFATREMILIVGSASLIPCLISSDGLFYKPELAIYLYLFYQYGKQKINPRRVAVR